MKPTYFVMVCLGVPPIQPIARGPDFRGNWRTGAQLTKTVPQPLLYTLDVDYPGTPKAMYGEKAIPVMRDDVVAVLKGCGVDNVQFFDAALHDPAKGHTYTNYKAYNIVGLIASADMSASTLMGTSDSRMLDTDFDSLVLDPAKPRGALMFRLAENVSAIVVHAQVRAAIEASGISGFSFFGPGEWSG